jgi:hypothetical protein
MIKFFRKIRKKLLTENRFSKYLLYAIGEIVLVVIGILIALQINNWNENQKTRNIEQQYLLDLKEEFSFNKNELVRVMNRNKKNADYALKLIDNTGPENPEITEEEFGNFALTSLSSEIQFNPSQGVLDEIISSGKLGIFGSSELKFALSSWTGRLYKVRLKEQELSRMRTRTIEMVRNKGNLGMVVSGSWSEELGIKRTKFKQGNLQLLKSVPFEGHMIGIATMSLNLNNSHYPKLVEEIDKILLLIDDEIKENKG